MLYLKKMDLSEFDDINIEKAIRQYSLKRHTSLDLQSSATLMRQEKYFIGFENQNEIMITRIRTPIERLLPKLIFQFSKHNFKECKIKFSLLPKILAIFLMFGILLQIMLSIKGFQISNEFVNLIMFSCLLALLTWIEIKLTTNKINKAIENIKVT